MWGLPERQNRAFFVLGNSQTGADIVTHGSPLGEVVALRLQAKNDCVGHQNSAAPASCSVANLVRT
jgi:hypothetical protein